MSVSRACEYPEVRERPRGCEHVGAFSEWSRSDPPTALPSEVRGEALCCRLGPSNPHGGGFRIRSCSAELSLWTTSGCRVELGESCFRTYRGVRSGATRTSRRWP